MEITKVESKDVRAIEELVKQVSEIDVIPAFNEQGQTEYRERVLTDIHTTFDEDRFTTLKLVVSNNIVGFGALREGNYLTHLFVSKELQGKGAGKRLLNALLDSTVSDHIDLRSSINAVDFYRGHGFEVTGDESEFNGIRFVPMRLSRFM
ncbi:GNAT family N-acetyltransferase [Vibrio profundi]|uniref:GNAT family N-acetyltransferase n=1 Tax=Vibrio profundi TaxID=1774960 RepID=UPI0037356DDF